MKNFTLTLLCGVAMLLMLCNFPAVAQKGPKAAAVRGEASSSNHIMLKDLKENVDDYLGNADLWAKKKEYWLIWIGWSSSNVVVRKDFKDHGAEFQQWLKDGGSFVGDTFSSDMHEIYELLPGKVRTQNQHASIETGHVVDKKHPLVTTPNDITDDKFYSNWAWTAGDIYTDWDEYIVIATREDKPKSQPLWLAHEKMPIVVTTMQPTWSGHMRPKMVENIHHYVKNFKPSAVDPSEKLPLTWAKVKTD